MDVLKQFIERDSRLTARYLSERLGWCHSTVETDLSELNKT